jgi:hypothetical protein
MMKDTTGRCTRALTSPHCKWIPLKKPALHESGLFVVLTVFF